MSSSQRQQIAFFIAVLKATSFPWWCLKYISILLLRVFLFCWEIEVVKMQRSWRVHPRDHQTVGRDRDQ